MTKTVLNQESCIRANSSENYKCFYNVQNRNQVIECIIWLRIQFFLICLDQFLLSCFSCRPCDGPVMVESIPSDDKSVSGYSQTSPYKSPVKNIPDFRRPCCFTHANSPSFVLPHRTVPKKVTFFRQTQHSCCAAATNAMTISNYFLQKMKIYMLF